MPEPLARGFYERETVEVARTLLGCTLVRVTTDGAVRGRIVETEAYGDADDLASHAARLKRGGVLAMHGPAGVAYVYRSYGIHAMFNIVAKPPGETGAILVRALEPLEGVDLMRARRGSAPDRKLASGPGNLCQAFGITLADHGTDLTGGERLWLERGDAPTGIMAGPRIGISRHTHLPWRFFDAESHAVSAHRRGEFLTE